MLRGGMTLAELYNDPDLSFKPKKAIKMPDFAKKHKLF